MKINKVIFYISILVVFILTSCYKDKGNYNYRETNVIEITGIPEQINVLGNIDTLVINPVVVSSLEGEITYDNENYSFVYAMDGSVDLGKMNYVAVDSTYPKNLQYFVSLPPDIYNLNFVVTDKRTGVQTLKPFSLNVTSAVTEGWLVLCNEGPENRVRLDMISVIDEDREVQAFDLAEPLGLPYLTNATRLSYVFKNPLEAKISIITEDEGAYNLLQSTLESGPSYNMLYEFGNMNENCKPQNLQSVSSGYYFIVDGDNNAYTQYYYVAGPIFEFPVNTSAGDKKPEFKVSQHFVSDPKPSGGSNSVLAYDITNKRFVNWSSGRETRMVGFESSENDLFNYNTGKDIVYMGSSLYGNSTAYAILESEGSRYLYSLRFIVASPAGRFEQADFDELTLPDINRAEHFVFHSTLPYMFYAVDSKLYQYDLVSKSNKLMKDFGDEKVTMLKFNLFKFNIERKPQEMLNKQYELIVGLENDNLPENNKGSLKFFEVPPLNQPLKLVKEYTGFARVVDVVYKEVPVF